MIPASKRSFAHALCGFAVRLAPRHRATLARAMLSELAHVPDKDVVSFAAGSLWSATAWRLATAETVIFGTRVAVASGAALLAVLAVSFAVRAGAHAPSAAAVAALLAIAAFYGAATVLALSIRLSGLVRYAALGLLLNFCVMIALSTRDAVANEAFLKALVVEEYWLLFGLIGVVTGAQWLARRLNAASP